MHFAPNCDTFVLTGATGFLGSHLLAALLERGKSVVVLGRDAGEETLSRRMEKILRWFGLEQHADRVETVRVDLLDPFCGLDKATYHAICARGGQVIHCASDTRFSSHYLREVTDTNVRSLKSVIHLARSSRASFFHYVSTAYVSGPTTSSCLEAPVLSGPFCNVYEETKAQAEREVASRCVRYGIPFTILRPSIVYGDSYTGRSNSFTALYHHVKSLYFIRDIYLKDIQDNGGIKSHQHGIFLDDAGILNLPLRIYLPRRGHVNLVPIDYFVTAALGIMNQSHCGRIYHITSDEPKQMEELAAYCERFLKIKGLEIIYSDPPKAFIPNPAEAMFNKFIEPYRPYLSDTRIFDRRNTNCATAGLFPPDLTYGVFERCMEYAVKANWGR